MKRNAADIARNLIRKLWEQYTERVPYARIYKELIEKRGGRVVIDHVAFRTLKTHTGEQPGGISNIRHIIKCFGYKAAGNYSFLKKKISAIHFEHPENDLPRFFVSQLEVEKFPPWAQQLINEAVKDTPYLLSDNGIELLNRLCNDGRLTAEAAGILEEELVDYFKRPWQIPCRETVLKLNDISQYAAWVLLHGNSVNHFAASVNEQNVEALPDLESTVRLLESQGIPMKEVTEGAKGSMLQQTATLAVKEETEVAGENGPEEINWTYAYFELTQRGYTEVDGRQVLYSGFLENQARHFFGMTQTLDN
ncbi:MAG: DUF1338 domain-containing protein [Tangfeifania sp.]